MGHPTFSSGRKGLERKAPPLSQAERDDKVEGVAHLDMVEVDGQS